MLTQFTHFSSWAIGTITVWDREQALVWFELKGRSNRISSVQFDSHRLVSDGTYSLVVIHNFDVPYGSSDEQFQYDVEYTPSEESGDDTNATLDRDAKPSNDSNDNNINGDVDDEGEGSDEDDDGTPSATS